MNIGKLKAVIAAYCKRTVGDFTLNGEDMLLVALNSARLEAEQMHDFVLSQVFADITINGAAGASLSSAVLQGTATAVSLKSIENIGLIDDAGNVVPARFFSDRTVKSQSLELSGFADAFDPEIRYPSDADLSSRLSAGAIVQHGGMLYIEPRRDASENFEVSVVGYRWMPDYEDDADTDFFTERAHNYLKWAAIVELNHIVKEFVPREEGNLPPPTTMKKEAMAAMELWDNFIITS